MMTMSSGGKASVSTVPSEGGGGSSAGEVNVLRMADFIRADLRGSRFERVDLSRAELRAVDLSGARFRGVDLSRAVMRGVELVDVDIHGEVVNLTVNGVDIGPLVNAELNRRYPDRAKMRPADPAGFVEAWDILERLWDQTVDRARRLPAELLQSRSVASGRSPRRCATWCSPPTPGSDGRSSAIRRRGIPWTCRGTRCPTPRACPATAPPGPSWTWCSNCVATGCPPCARSSGP